MIVGTTPITRCEVVRNPAGKCRVRYVAGGKGETFEFKPKDPDDLEDVRHQTTKRLILLGHYNLKCLIQFCEGEY